MANAPSQKTVPLAQTPLERSLAALMRPLEFAVGKGRGKLARIHGLEANTTAACRSLQAMSLPRDLIGFLKEVEGCRRAEGAYARALLSDDR